MNNLNIKDLEALSVGATVLGSGGGGSTDYAILMADYSMSKYGNVSLINVEDLRDDDIVVPIGYMGAPLVTQEKLPSGREFDLILKAITKYYNKEIKFIMPVEIGGANAFSPIFCATKNSLKILDADLIGRAFPKLNMSSANLFDINCSPAFLCDATGNITIIEAIDADNLEKISRSVTITGGSSLAIAIYIMTGEQAKYATVKNTINQAYKIGQQVLQSYDLKENINDLINRIDGAELIGSGSISDVSQNIVDGFLIGTVIIDSELGETEIYYQNEYLYVKSRQKFYAITPEIIVIIEQNSFKPITSDRLRCGMRVHIFSIEAPAIWTSERGMNLVGPDAFQIEVKKDV